MPQLNAWRVEAAFSSPSFKKITTTHTSNGCFLCFDLPPSPHHYHWRRGGKLHMHRSLPNSSCKVSKLRRECTRRMVIAEATHDSRVVQMIPLPSSESEEDYDFQPADIPILSLSEMTKKFQQYASSEEKHYRAMYSSIVGAITRDVAAMVLPIDDHMVHRGHAVFDTATIADGYLYDTDAHLDRFLESASHARITPPFSRSALRDILIQTVAASSARNGHIRYWLSAGPGNFELSPVSRESASFYAVVIEEIYKRSNDGVKVVTTSIPIKAPQFATVKSTNYLPNALVKMEAEDKGAFTGIWLDGEGFIGEAPNMNVVFVNKQSLLVPSFEKILRGCTTKRLLTLAQKLFSNPDLHAADPSAHQGLLTDIQVRNVTVDEAKAADEMMLVVSSSLIIPVIEWDGQRVGQGIPGPVNQALIELIEQDRLQGSPDYRLRILYKE